MRGNGPLKVGFAVRARCGVEGDKAKLAGSIAQMMVQMWSSEVRDADLVLFLPTAPPSCKDVPAPQRMSRE